MADITRVNTADELEQKLLDNEWAYITQDSGSVSTLLCLICPFCNAMVPPMGNAGVDFKRHHIRFHVEQWRQIDRAAWG